MAIICLTCLAVWPECKIIETMACTTVCRLCVFMSITVHITMTHFLILLCCGMHVSRTPWRSGAFDCIMTYSLSQSNCFKVSQSTVRRVVSAKRRRNSPLNSFSIFLNKCCLKTPVSNAYPANAFQDLRPRDLPSSRLEGA